MLQGVADKIQHLVSLNEELLQVIALRMETMAKAASDMGRAQDAADERAAEVPFS